MAGRAYDFWLLDLDGTIVDVESGYVHEVIDEVGDRLGESFTPTEAEHLWYEVEADRAAVLEEHGVDPSTFWSAFHEVEDPVARAAATYVYDDAADFVPAREEPVGVVTHCQSYLTEPILESLDIADWFDTVVCCSEDVGWKPDPGPVELAMKDLDVGYNGHVGVLAGDSPADVGAARNAGLEAAHVDRSGVSRGVGGSLGDRRVTSLTELDA